MIVVQTLSIISATHSALPLEDEWASLLVFKAMLGGAHRLQTLFSQHNEHRIAVPRLVFFADYLYFHGRGWLDFAAIFAIQALHATLLTVLGRAAARTARDGLVLAGLPFALLFALRQSENFHWNFQVQFVGVFAAASLAAALFAAALSPHRPAGLVLMIGAFVAASLAAFSMTNGLAAAPVLVAMAMLAGARRRVVLGTAVFALALLAGFSLGYTPGGAGVADRLGDPLRLARFTCAYLGTFLDPDLDLATAFGAFGVVATLAIAARFALGRDRDPARLALLGIALFALASAAVTALGRAADGLGGAMASRYATGAATFWSALLLCGWSLAGPSARPVAVRLLVGCAVLVLLVAIGTSQAPTRAVMRDIAARQQALEDGLVQGLIDAPALEALSAPVDLVPEGLALLKARRLSLFAGRAAALFGRPLGDAGPVAAEACPGLFTAAVAAPELGVAGVRVAGAFAQPARAMRRVVLAMDGERIAGFATSPFGAAHWTGYATAAPGARLDAYAWRDDGLCRLGQATVAPAS